jgi:hypothetical protein
LYWLELEIKWKDETLRSLLLRTLDGTPVLAETVEAILKLAVQSKGRWPASPEGGLESQIVWYRPRHQFVGSELSSEWVLRSAKRLIEMHARVD